MYSSAKNVGVARSQPSDQAQQEAGADEGGEQRRGAGPGAREGGAGRRLDALGRACSDGHRFSIGVRAATVSDRRVPKPWGVRSCNRASDMSLLECKI